MKDSILVLDFGGQYASLIARRVRTAGIYCEVHSYRLAEQKISELRPKGIILSGGPQSVYKTNAPIVKREIFPKGVPVLGICYGAQLIAFLFGGKVMRSPMPEYGLAKTELFESPLFSALPNEGITWMSHADYIQSLPDGFVVTASTKSCKIAGMQSDIDKVFALQFHPEVQNTENGFRMIENFLFKVCKLSPNWKMDSFLDSQIAEIRQIVCDKRVILGLSGGVDSSVCAALLSRAIGKQLTCVFVDHGLMRKDEGDWIESVFSKMDMNFVRVQAADRFLTALKGIRQPERKRKIIGAEFVRVFEEQAKRIGADFLAQGTIYPDIIESGKSGGAVIKSHHNVGGLPFDLSFKGVIEPLRSLFKDEVREVGRLLDLSNAFVERQPFPGPGLAIRIIGTVTRQKLEMLRQADHIFSSEITKSGLENSIHQFFALLTNVRSVGVMGDGRTYGLCLALRAVTTLDFMTADFARIPYDVLARASARISNEVRGITRVVYDISTKPPATIEWE